MPSSEVQPQDLIKAVSALDSDLKSWAAKRYGLISAGPPPKYERTWLPDDLIFAQQWDQWITNFKNTPIDSENIEYIKNDIGKWQSLAENREVELSNPDDKAIRTADDSKESKIPWFKVALGVAAAGGAYLWLTRKKSEIEPTGAVVQVEKPLPLEERVSRLMTTGTRTSRR